MRLLAKQPLSYITSNKQIQLVGKVIWHNKDIKSIWAFKPVVHLLQINFWQMETRQHLKWKYIIILNWLQATETKEDGGVMFFVEDLEYMDIHAFLI